MKTEDEQLCESLWDTALDCWDMHFCVLATTGFLDLLSADPTVRWLRPHPISYSHKMCVCDFSLYQFCFFRKSWLIQTGWGTWSSLAEKQVSQLPEEGRRWYLLTQGSWLSALPSGHPESKANENLQSQMWVHLAEGLTLWTWPTFWTRILTVITPEVLNQFPNEAESRLGASVCVLCQVAMSAMHNNVDSRVPGWQPPDWLHVTGAELQNQS